MRASVGIVFFCLVLAVHGSGLASEPEAENKRGADRVDRQAGDGKKEDKARLVIAIAYSVCEEGKVIEDVTIDGVDRNDREELLACLKRRADEAGKDDKGKSKLLVQFKVDGRVLYRTVADIIEMCRRVGISRIQFVAPPKPGASAVGETDGTSPLERDRIVLPSPNGAREKRRLRTHTRAAGNSQGS